MSNLSEVPLRKEDMPIPKKGALIYKPRFLEEAKTREVLQKFFPNRDLFIRGTIDFRRPMLYPHDYGTELGDTFYGKSIPPLDYSNYQLDRLPKVGKSTMIEGGKCVFIPRTNIVFYSGSILYDLIGLNYQTIDARPVNEAAKMYRRKLGNHPIREDDYWSLSEYHIDLVMAGVEVPDHGVHAYMHEGVYDVLRDENPNFLKQLQEQAISLFPSPKELAEQGGLNIPYIDGKVLVPTYKVIGPLLDDYDKAGIPVIPMGAEQFNIFEAAGIKCRSLVLDYIN